jgi:hypothetical protein
VGYDKSLFHDGYAAAMKEGTRKILAKNVQLYFNEDSTRITPPMILNL